MGRGIFLKVIGFYWSGKGDVLVPILPGFWSAACSDPGLEGYWPLFWSGFALLWPLVRSLFPFGRLVFGRVRGWLELALTEEAGSFFESLLCTFCTSLHILQILFANFCTVLWLVMRGSTCHSSCCEKYVMDFFSKEDFNFELVYWK